MSNNKVFILLFIVFVLWGVRTEAYRIPRPNTFILPWTEEQMSQHNEAHEDLWNLQNGEFNFDIVTTTKSSAANGDMWIYTGTVGTIQYMVNSTVHEALGSPYSATDRIDINSYGQITLSGKARVEKYMDFAPPSVTRVVGGSPPDIGTEGTFSTLLFASNVTEEVWFNVHIPPDWAVGTDLEIAVYWSPTDGNAGTVAWEFDYEALASESNETLGSGSTHVNIHDATQSLDNELLETAYGDIDGAGLAVDDTIGIHFYRDHDDAADNYGTDAALIHIEVEYKADKLGEAT